MLIRSLYQDLMPDLHKVQLHRSSQMSCPVLDGRTFLLLVTSVTVATAVLLYPTAALGLPLHTAPHRLDTAAMLTFSAGLSLLTSLLFLFLLVFFSPLLSLLLLTRLTVFHCCCCSHPLPGSHSKTPFCFLFPSLMCVLVFHV